MTKQRHEATLRIERQRQVQRRVYNEYVLWTALQYGIYWGVFGMGLGFVITHGAVLYLLAFVGPLPWARFDAYLFALPFGMIGFGFGAGVELLKRVREWEDRNMITDVREESQPAAPTHHERPFTVNGVPTYRRADVLLRYGGQSWEWQGAELDTMLRWYNKGIAKVRRDHDPDNGRPGLMAFNRITTADYGTIKSIMTGLKIIDERGYWTEQGGEWLKTAGLPSPQD
jgi:hypothetical protein